MSEKEFEIFAKRLKELRSVEGLTQAKLAKRLNVYRSCLANYESHKRKPDEEMVRTIANYFGVSEAYLTGNKKTYFPIDDNRGHDLDIAEFLSSDGQLDISGVSPTAKIALIEFYNYLMDRSQHEKNEMNPPEKAKTGSDQ